MCQDPNAGIRAQARIRNKEKHGKYYSEALKFHNRGTAFVTGKQNITTAFSRANSDAYQKTLYALGQGRKLKAQSFAQFAKSADYLASGSQKTSMSYRARNLNAKYKKLLSDQSRIESTVTNILGRKTATIQQNLIRQKQVHLAKNRQALGIRPEFGSPVYMPPKNRGAQVMGAISAALSIAAIAMPVVAPAFAASAAGAKWGALLQGGSLLASSGT